MFKTWLNGVAIVIIPIKISASEQRLPASNHFSGFLLRSKITKLEFMKDRNKHLKATDTFILVMVSCFSLNENILMIVTSVLLTMNMIIELQTEIN